MLSRFAFLILASFFAIPGFASKAQPYPCVAKISAYGDARYFWLWGKDAWEGSGVIECASADVPRRREVIITVPVHVRFEAWSPGFGATRESIVALELTGFKSDQIGNVYGTYRTAGGRSVVDFKDEQYLMVAINGNQQWHWTVSPGRSAAEMAAFLHFGQLIVKPGRIEE